MKSEINLRANVVYRGDAAGLGTIAFQDGARFENVHLHGVVAGCGQTGRTVVVNVLSAVYPTSSDSITKREHFPALVVVSVETEYLRGMRDILSSLFYLPWFVEGHDTLDPTRTVALGMHGSAGLNDETIRPGYPCVPGQDTEVLFLNATAVAQVVRWARGPHGERPTVLVNIGCFSSTRHQGAGPTFNEELGALLAGDGVAVYGPPHAGVVTAANWFGKLRELFGQRIEDEISIQSAPIRFQKVPSEVGATPAQFEDPKPSGSDDAPAYGCVVITNHARLAIDLATYSPDFASARSHHIDRNWME
jgi:hypothetical protein